MNITLGKGLRQVDNSSIGHTRSISHWVEAGLSRGPRLKIRDSEEGDMKLCV